MIGSKHIAKNAMFKLLGVGLFSVCLTGCTVVPLSEIASPGYFDYIPTRGSYGFQPPRQMAQRQLARKDRGNPNVSVNLADHDNRTRENRSVASDSLQPHQSNQQLQPIIRPRMREPMFNPAPAQPEVALVSVNEKQPSWNAKKWNQKFANARKLESGGRQAEAIMEYESLLAENDSSVDVLHRLAVLYDQTEQFDRALPMFHQALAANPKNAELLCDFGFHCQLLNDQIGADQFYRRAIAADPKHRRAHNHLGVLLAQANQTDLAMQHFRAAGLSTQQAKQNLEFIQTR